MKIPVVLTHHSAYVKCNDKLRDQLVSHWSFMPDGYRFMPRYKQGVWDGRIRLFQRGVVPSGLFRATYKKIQDELGIEFQIDSRLEDRIAVAPLEKEADPKYQYQDECVDAMRKVYHRGGGTILAATRSGKTRIAGRFLASVNGYGLFVVDQLDLLHQTQQELEKWTGEKIGVVGDSEFLPQRLTVGTIQTLHGHIEDPKFQDWYSKVEVMIVDELHEALASRNFSVLEAVKPKARYGLTATLQLQKKNVSVRVYAFTGPVIFRFPVATGMESGVLSKGRVLQILFEEAFVGRDYANYVEHYDADVIDHPVKREACRKITEVLLNKGRYVMILVERIEHLKMLDVLFKDIPHKCAYGDIKVAERRSLIKDFEEGKIRLIIANKVFRKGVTISRVDALIDWTEGKSKNNAQQRFGRALGLHQDKQALVLHIDFGTYGKGNRFHSAARSRAKAFTAAEIELATIKVASVDKAVKAVELSC